MKKKKIAFIIESLDLGGAEKSLVTLLQNMDYSRFEIDLLTLVEDGIFSELVPEEVNREPIRMRRISLFQRLRFFLHKKMTRKLHASQVLWNITKDNYLSYPTKYDVAIAYSQGFATYYVDKCIQAPVKYCWINIDYTKAGYNMAFDYPFYQRYSKVVSVSPEVKEGLKKELDRIGKRLDVAIVKDITDKKIVQLQADRYMPTEFSPNKISIVTVCRLAKQKGLHLAVEACERLVKRGLQIEWFVVGEGRERAYLEHLIQDKGIESDMKLLGARPNPYPYMKHCDIYVQTSLFEGLGLSVIEASYLNKPIVCTDFPTAFSILRDGETGLIVEMDAESIANQISRLISDENLKNRLITNLEKQENDDKEQTLAQIEKLLS